MFKKNKLTKIHFPLVNRDTGFGVSTGTANVTVYHEGTVFSTSTIIPGTNHLSDGFWFFEMITAAMNADSIGVGITHANAVPQMVNIRTVDFEQGELYAGITELIAGVTIGHAGTSIVTDITDFHTSTAGLSTFDFTTDGVTLATAVPDVNIISVAGSGVAGITAFHANTNGILATVSGTIDANIISVGGSGITDITDFYTSTSGLSTFDFAIDGVNITTNGIDSAAFATSAVNEILNGLYTSTVDGSITHEQLMEMLLALLSGKIDVVDNGATRTITYYRRDGVATSFSVVVSEIDSQEGSRSTGGTIV